MLHFSTCARDNKEGSLVVTMTVLLFFSRMLVIAFSKHYITMVPVTDLLAENIFTQNIVDNLVVKSTEGRVQDHNRGGTVETPDINLELRTVLQSCIILGVLPGQTYSLPLTP